METEFVRLSHPKVPAEIWVETTLGRYQILQKFRSGANGVVDYYVIYDSEEGERFDETFRANYEAKNYVNNFLRRNK